MLKDRRCYNALGRGSRWQSGSNHDVHHGMHRIGVVQSEFEDNLLAAGNGDGTPLWWMKSTLMLKAMLVQWKEARQLWFLHRQQV